MSSTQANVIIVLLWLMLMTVHFCIAAVAREIRRLREALEDQWQKERDRG